MNILDLNQFHHRTKERIRSLGEVFTSEKYVEEMLDLLSRGRRNFWSCEDNVFFEPCSGHGNFVLGIYNRRLNALYNASLPNYTTQTVFYAVANSLNTIWALDICPENISICRSRIFLATMNFVLSKTKYQTLNKLIQENQDFFAHVICAIKWHIEVNETLSALSNLKEAENEARKTIMGKKWIKKNGQNSLNFNLTWCEFFYECEDKDLIPVEYEKAIKVLRDITLSKNIPTEYDFLKLAMNQQNLDSRRIS